MSDEKKTFSERFAEYFMSIDLKEIVKSEFENNIWPRFLDTIVDTAKAAFSNLVDEIAYKGDKKRASVGRGGGRLPFNYNSISDGPRRRWHRPALPRALQGQANYVVEDIMFKTRQEAMDVLNYLQNILDDDRYDFVTVFNLYNTAKIPTNSTMEDWGWFSLENARVFAQNDKWVLRMPTPEPIED